jgi:hypothetical protein
MSSLKTNIKSTGKYRFTPDGLFAIDSKTNNSEYLYIKKDNLHL